MIDVLLAINREFVAFCNLPLISRLSSVLPVKQDNRRKCDGLAKEYLFRRFGLVCPA